MMAESLRRQALRELDSEQCVCGKSKKSGQSFCRSCYFALPVRLQKALYKHISEGYGEIYDEAKTVLRAEVW